MIKLNKKFKLKIKIAKKRIQNNINFNIIIKNKVKSI